MAYWNGSYSSNPRVLNVISKPSIGSFSVATTNAERALLSNSHIFTLKLSTSEAREIREFLKTESPLSLLLQNMRKNFLKSNYSGTSIGNMSSQTDSFIQETQRAPLLDFELLEDLKEKINDEAFMKMLEERRKLPAYKRKSDILSMIQRHQVTLISGDTGCGKTTQIPQYILDESIISGSGSLCKIICTQPRRISAISAAERISKERIETIGKSCGYQIRMEKNLPRKQGSILFATNGMVLRFMESNPTLNGVSHLILDEIHERDNHTDFLLAVVKQLITKRSDIKIILMSATLNEQSFRTYFNNCPHLKIDRLSFEVEEIFLEDIVLRLNFKFPSCTKTLDSLERNKKIFNSKVVPYVRQITRSRPYTSEHSRQLQNPMSEELNLDLIYALAMDICAREAAGGILIFVTGFEDIKKLKAKFDNFSRSRIVVITLHSQLPIEQQKSIFESAPTNARKIIISTNIAETSITVEDVVYVIDSGWAKVKSYDARTKTENLEPRFISKANAIQRKGRAGRTCPGKCFRLYTRARFEEFYDYQKPEIRRSRLEDIILQTKLLGFRSVQNFFHLLMDQPKQLIVDRSMHVLRQIGAFESGEELSLLGYYMAKLPVSPQLGKMLLYGIVFRCLDPIISIVVALDYKNPFMLNFNQTNCNSKLLSFSESCKSDHLLLYKALHLFINTNLDLQEEMCRKFDLNSEIMTTLAQMKSKFMEDLFDLNLVPGVDSTMEVLNENSDNIQLLKSIISAGLYPNVVFARTQPKRSFLTPDRTEVGIHKKSVLYAENLSSTSPMVYYIKLKTGKMDLLHDATIISPFPLFFFAESAQVHVEGLDTLGLLTSLKRRFQEVVDSKLLNPGAGAEECSKAYENRLLGIMIRLLSCSEKSTTSLISNPSVRRYSRANYYRDEDDMHDIYYDDFSWELALDDMHDDYLNDFSYEVAWDDVNDDSLYPDFDPDF